MYKTEIHVNGTVKTIYSRKAGSGKSELEELGLVKADYSGLFESLENSKSSECSICTELGSKLVKLRCGHKFHLDCINRWTEDNITCPNCRRELK